MFFSSFSSAVYCQRVVWGEVGEVNPKVLCVSSCFGGKLSECMCVYFLECMCVNQGVVLFLSKLSSV